MGCNKRTHQETLFQFSRLQMLMKDFTIDVKLNQIIILEVIVSRCMSQYQTIEVALVEKTYE